MAKVNEVNKNVLQTSGPRCSSEEISRSLAAYSNFPTFRNTFQRSTRTSSQHTHTASIRNNSQETQRRNASRTFTDL
jgi:hypothetical protein